MNKATLSSLRKLAPTILSLRHMLIFMALASTVVVSLVFAFLLRFDFAVPPAEFRHLRFGLLVALPLKLIAFYLVRMHRGWLTFSGFGDLRRVVHGSLFGSAVLAAAMYGGLDPAFPRSVTILDGILCFGGICSYRMLVRVMQDATKYGGKLDDRRGVLIYGAGGAGVALAREILANKRLGYALIGFLDDDESKGNEMLLGVPVLGRGQDAKRIVASRQHRDLRVQEILIAMPTATAKQMRQAVIYCRAAGVAFKTLPAMGTLLTDRRLSLQIREISLEDLLFREPAKLDDESVSSMVHGRSVLVTGAAGSIGSELCRQIASYSPSKLVMLDQAESDLFRIDLDFRGRDFRTSVVSVIADIRDPKTIEEVIKRHETEIIFHAAAYKHVPLMEAHVVEAARNNILGTWNLAEAASKAGVSTFVMISSDKAVNPTNVMGATKRAAELIVSSFWSAMKDKQTKFVSVRFGNVLGSNGSVVPIFQSQIAAGGPVTVTHPEVRRFFMTIREAVQLVLQASTMGKNSEIFVLDMGAPVRILDLARNVIKLAGLRPDEDIAIRFTGLRPGEKLYEEVISEGEKILPTYHKKIKIFVGEAADHRSIRNWVDSLRGCVETKDSNGVIRHLLQLVPEYQVSDVWRQRLSGGRGAAAD